MAKRMDTAGRARRLLALLPMLKRGAPLALDDLAAAVGCSTDEVASDLATLTMCGIPPFSPSDMIELDLDGNTATVYVEPPALDRPLRFTPAEARALVTALEAAGHDPAGPLITKLLTAAAAAVSADEIERTVRAGDAPDGTTSDVHSALALAVEQQTAVRFTYFTGSSGRTSERVVHPFTLTVRFGVWYLVAHCRTAGEERVFRLDRIRSVEMTNERFERPAVFATTTTPAADALPVAEIVFSRSASLPDEHEWPGAVFTPRADGTTLVRVGYQSPGWIARRVVAYLGDAEVLGPPEIRQAVRDLALDISENAC